MALILKNGVVVTAADTCKADVKIEGEIITHIGRNLPSAIGDQTIDAIGKYIFPGGVDAHTHFELPFMGTYSADDFHTGT
ncbi:MAG TPA: dihydropyrimidinase, partial [bacterium]|nr:dihydropyrimidinase [bacterium]